MKKPLVYIKEAFKAYTQKENFIFFAKVMAILTIISTGLSYLSAYLYPVNVYEEFDFSNPGQIAGFASISIAMILFGIYTQSTTIAAVLNQNYLVAVWVGNNDNSPMARVASGVTGASPIWNKIMSALLNNAESKKWEVPEGMVQKVCFGKTEWYLEEKTQSCPQIIEPAASL
jgi:hypothetical protein